MAKKFLVRGDIPKEPAMTIEGQLIVSPGEYYGIPLTKEKIQEHMKITDWTDRFNTSLVYGHKTNTTTKWLGNSSPDDWAGYFSPPQYLSLSDGVSVEGAYSNIYIYDEDLARKLAYGRLKCGVSLTFDLENGGIKNLSVVDNPKCKQAFLNLSDAGGRLNSVEIVSPSFLNLSEEDAKDNTQTENSPTLERGENSKNTMTEKTNKTEKEIELENKIAELEKQIEEKPKESQKPVKDEVVVEDEAKKDPEANKPAEEPEKPVATNLSNTEADTKEKDTVVITPESGSDDSAVASAIEKMADKVAAELKKASVPQSVAPTSPNTDSSRDDEVTQSLVEKYKSLHNLE